MSASAQVPKLAPLLSIVIPFLNEQEVLEETYRRLKAYLDPLEIDYELVFVDDGSSDQSRVILTAKALADPRVRIVTLSRNFGHEMATSAGLQFAQGQAAIVMDADLQDPPELIEQFLDKWRQGYQVVYGIRRQRDGESILKKTTSFIFYRLLRLIADIPIPAETGDFRLLDRRVLEVYRQFQEDPRFFRGLISWIGFRQIGIPFVRRRRAGGRSKYRYGRLLRLAFDSITAFSTLPAACITVAAGGMAVLSLLFTLVVVCLWTCNVIALAGWMWGALGFLFLWNVQFISMAVLGEYVIRTHRHTLRRPLYVVESVIEQSSLLKEGKATQVSDHELPPICHPSALCKV